MSRIDEHGDLIGPDGYTDANRPDDDLPDFATPYWKERIMRAPVRRGRPPSPAPKVQTTLRLDPDVVAKFRATGPGWQSRINAALRAARPEDFL